MLDNLTIVLCKTKFPENVGSVARAMANMGCSDLVLVNPQNWDMDKALPLATPKGAEILRKIRIEPDLADALAGFSSVFGTTARGGGWRKGIKTPSHAAEDICRAMADRDPADGLGGPAVVFGPEDRGLTNEEIEICGQLLTIPTVSEASSLNLAQAALIILYECFRAAPGTRFRPAGPAESRPATHREQQTLFETIKHTLLAIDFLKDDNPDYWMLPFRRFAQRVKLKRNEFNLLMGVCRQVLWLNKKAARSGTGENKSSGGPEE